MSKKTIEEALKYAGVNLPDSCLISITIGKQGYDVELSIIDGGTTQFVSSSNELSIAEDIVALTEEAPDYI